MSNAHRSIDWRGGSYAGGDLCAPSNDLLVKPADAAAARDSPALHLTLPPTNEVAFDVSVLRGVDSTLTYPLVVTWELLVGSERIVDARRVLRRKTTLASAAEVRVGRLFSYTGPVFRQALLVARLPATAVGSVAGFLDVSAGFRHAVVGEAVTVGSAVG